MKILLALVALGLVVIAVIILMIKRSSVKSKPETDNAIKQLKPRMVAPKVQSAQSDNTASRETAPQPVQSEMLVQPEPSPIEAEILIQPETSPIEPELPSQPVASVVENKIDTSTKIQSLGTVSYSLSAVKPETIPEDSVLRRHFLSTRQAEKLAITNPYPTDSTLRRHYESLLSLLLKTPPSVTKEVVTADQSANKLKIPEDSTLRRHFLTQMQAESNPN